MVKNVYFGENMNIRPMAEKDCDAIHMLWETHGVKTKADSAAHETHERTIRFLRRNPSTCFVAEKDGEIVGTIMGGHDGYRGFIYQFMVEKNNRRQGIGKQLLETVMPSMTEAQLVSVEVIATPANMTVKEYEGLGNFLQSVRPELRIGIL